MPVGREERRRPGARARRPWLALLIGATLVMAGLGVAPVRAEADTWVGATGEVRAVTLGGQPVPGASGPIVATLVYNQPDLRTYAGNIGVSNIEQGWFEVTREVEGVGPVTLEVRPIYPGQTIADQTIHATVDGDGALTVHPQGGVLDLVFEVSRMTYGSVDEQLSGCYYYAFGEEAAKSGQVYADGIAIRHQTVITGSSCQEITGVVSTVMMGPASVELWFPGSHPIVTEDVASNLVVTPRAPGGTTHDAVSVDVAVTYTTAGVERVPQVNRMVRAYEDDLEVASAELDSDGEAVLTVDLTGPGPRQYEVRYEGQTFGDLAIPAASSTTFVLESAPFPDGAPVSGAVTIDGWVSPIPPGAVWTGGDYDRVTGVLAPGAFHSPVGPLSLPSPSCCEPYVVEQRLVQLGDVAGQIRPDGTVVLDPVEFKLDFRSAVPFGDLGRCETYPFSVSLSGTADSDGLHLVARPFTAGRITASNTELMCAGQSGGINEALHRRPIDLRFHVAGDFTPPESETEIAVQSWFDEVGQFNPTILTSQVTEGDFGRVSSGTVEFRDGEQLLATAPVHKGIANAMVFMSSPGTRVVTASYSGVGHEPSSSSTSLVVTPAPSGDDLIGGLSINGWEVAPGTSGVVSGPLAPGGIASWLPVTLENDVGCCPSSAEVRLVPLGELIAEGSGVRGYYWLHLRSVSRDGVTTTPLGCVAVVTVDFQDDGTGGWAASGSVAPFASGWGCRSPLAAEWTDALTGEVTGALALAD